MGSTYLHHLIKSCEVEVQKTHDPLEVVDYPNTVLVMISRRDIFSSIMSQMIWNKTREHISYTNMHVDPFEIDASSFDSAYTWQKNFQQQHDFSRPYKEIFKFEFEQILQNHNIVFDTLNIRSVRKINLPPKSPYRYQDLVLNLDQCQIWYNNYELAFPQHPYPKKLSQPMIDTRR